MSSFDGFVYPYNIVKTYLMTDMFQFNQEFITALHSTLQIPVVSVLKKLSLVCKMMHMPRDIFLYVAGTRNETIRYTTFKM